MPLTITAYDAPQQSCQGCERADARVARLHVLRFETGVLAASLLEIILCDECLETAELKIGKARESLRPVRKSSSPSVRDHDLSKIAKYQGNKLWDTEEFAYGKIVAETEKAVLVYIEDVGKDVWFPKSQVVDITADTIEVTRGMAKQAGLL